MPIKYKDLDTEPNDIIHGTTPIVEKLTEKHKADAVSDMMSNIIDEKQKMKNTALMDMAGVLTPVKYYQKLADYNNNYNVSNNPPNDLSINVEKFYEIKNFKVKLSQPMTPELEGDDDNKSYITSGSLIILPRTIKPNEGDLMIMKYYQHNLCYQISKVDIKSYEEDSGFECEFTLYKEDFVVDPQYIVKTFNYIQELVGTSYRPILTDVEYENLQKFEEVYNRMSTIFNSLFYNKQINGYLLKKYEEKPLFIENNNNIDTLKSRNGLYRANSHYEDRYNEMIPIAVRKEPIAYDNLLNLFLSKNRVFRNFDGLLISAENLLPLDRVAYKRSIFGCLETRTVANYKNIKVSPVDITVCRPGIPAFFVGKTNMIHEGSDSHERISLEESESSLFPTTLTNQLLNGSNVDMSKSCDKMVYSSIESFIIDTITRFVYKKTDDFTKRFLYLHENMDNLYEDNVNYENIYYLYPLLGYVIEQSIEKMYDDNIFLR